MLLPLIIIASWIVVLSAVVGVCVSARRGDTQQLANAPAQPANNQQPQQTTWPASSPQPAISPIALPEIAAPVITAQVATQPGGRAYPCNPASLTGSTTG
jgi:hypothetical protein